MRLKDDLNETSYFYFLVKQIGAKMELLRHNVFRFLSRDKSAESRFKHNYAKLCLKTCS